MKIYDLIYITFQNFRNRKSRVFFTVLGVAIAIAVVLSLVSFGYGLQKSLLEKITTEEALLALDVLPSNSEIILLNNETIKKIMEMPGVDKVSPEANFNGQILFGGITSESSVNIVNSDFLALDGKVPMHGKFFTEKDSKKIVVSSLVAQLFNMKNDEIIGKKMYFSFSIKNNNPNSKASSTDEISLGEDFDIIGVVDGSGNTGEVFLNIKDFPNIKIDSYQLAKVKVKNSAAIETIRGKFIEMGFIVSSLSDIVDQANKIFSVIQITLGIFGVFALVVAAIGLVNTMTISLLERTNEIGIMRAIGAAPKDIKKIFLGESIMIGFMGGVFGIIVGIVISEILNWLFNILASSFGGEQVRLFVYPFWFILFIILLSTIVGFAGGVWPAMRAASMNPLKALRYK
jgi:putative ABC transport system permease protein